MSTTITKIRSGNIPVTITPVEMVDKLRRYAVERQIAFKRYADNHATSEKIKATLEIIEDLDVAEKCLSSTECVKRILKTKLNFHFIAPTGNRKDFLTWYLKIEECMSSCREFLNWSTQNWSTEKNLIKNVTKS